MTTPGQQPESFSNMQVTVDSTFVRIPRPPDTGNLWFVQTISCNVKCPPTPTINFLGTGPRKLKGSEIDSKTLTAILASLRSSQGKEAWIDKKAYILDNGRKSQKILRYRRWFNLPVQKGVSRVRLGEVRERGTPGLQRCGLLSLHHHQFHGCGKLTTLVHVLKVTQYTTTARNK